MHPSPYHLLIALLGAASLAGPVLANPTQCSYGQLTRSIEVVYAHPGQAVPCEVIYNKSMESSVETLWRADSEAGYCEARAQALIDKLAGFGWRCEKVAATIRELPTEFDPKATVAEQPAGADTEAVEELLGDDPPSAAAEAAAPERP